MNQMIFNSIIMLWVCCGISTWCQMLEVFLQKKNKNCPSLYHHQQLPVTLYLQLPVYDQKTIYMKMGVQNLDQKRASE